MRTGSPRNITVKGRHEAEYAWFKIADSLPFLSQSAENAAKYIVEAIQLGKTEITLTYTAKVVTALHAIIPGVFTAALRLVNRLLLRKAMKANQQPVITYSQALPTKPLLNIINFDNT
jgi:hypothetical protein